METARKLLECGGCGLWYFSHIPKRNILFEILDEPAPLERWSQSDRPTFQRARAVLKSSFPQGGRILDIGAHTGGFLKTLGDEWQKSAVEPMLASTEIPEDMVIYNAFLEDLELPASCFDCITAFDVFEHFENPGMVMGKIRRALKPGAIVLIETGNNSSFFANLLRAGWYYLSYLEHFQVFSQESFERLFRCNSLHLFSARKIVRDNRRMGAFTRAALISSVYVLLTIGRQPRLWRYMSNWLRRGHNATPPITTLLEPDHLFIAAQKLQ